MCRIDVWVRSLRVCVRACAYTAAAAARVFSYAYTVDMVY